MNLFKKTSYISLGLILFSSSLFAQDWTDNVESFEKKKKSEKSPFFFGINIGAFFANNNTAIIYTGANNVTDFGIDYVLNLSNQKLVFDEYFQHPYYVAELPLSPSYKTALDIGLHAGINLGGGNTIYIDINSSNVNYEQFFIIAIDDPNNQSPDPTFEQIPIIGKEKRINFNLGTQLSLYNEEKTTVYWPFFGNFNSIKLDRNYIVINNREYELFQNSINQANTQTGGIGFGIGSGLGIKYKLTDKITADLAYNLYYIKTKMNDNIQGFGINNGILLRIIWN